LYHIHNCSTIIVEKLLKNDDNMKGLASAVLAGIVVIILIVAGAAYYGSLTGFFAAGPSGGQDADSPGDGQVGSGDTGLVTGTPVFTGSDQAEEIIIGQDEPEPPETGDDTGDTTTTTTSSGSSGGSSSGGGGGGSSCTPDWQYSAWTACSPSGTSTRTATDYRCQTGTRTETRSCDYVPPEPPASVNTGIWVEPENTSISMANQSSFTVDIYINTTDDVYAVSFDLEYDPSMATVDASSNTSIIEGDFLKQDGATTFPVINSIDNGIGKVMFANTRYGIQYGISGEGTLATITFNAITTGSFDLVLSATAIDNQTYNLDQFTANVKGGHVEILA
jgi:hypothetical protein